MDHDATGATPSPHRAWVMDRPASSMATTGPAGPYPNGGVGEPRTAAERRAFYDEHGYLVVPELLSAAEVAELRAALDDVLERARGLTESDEHFFVLLGDDGQPGITRVRHPIAQHEAFRRLISHPKLLDLVEQLIGPNIEFVHSKINLKPPRNESAAYPWHQDWPFNPHTNLDMLAVMMPLDDATEENGCLQVIPGSHRLGPVEHYHRYPFKVKDERLVSDSSSWLSLEVPAGGVTLHHCCLLHSSHPNRGTTSRNAILFDYRAADNMQLGRATGPSRGLLVRGQDPLTVRMIAGTFKIRDESRQSS